MDRAGGFTQRDAAVGPHACGQAALWAPQGVAGVEQACFHHLAEGNPGFGPFRARDLQVLRSGRQDFGDTLGRQSRIARVSLNADKAAPHPLGHRACDADAKKRIEDDIPRMRGG